MWPGPALAAGAPGPGAAAKVACGAKVPGVEELLKPRALVVFGEVSGTVEGPRFFGEVICQALAQGLKVRVGLLIPQDEQADLDAFMSEAAIAAKDTALPRTAFWRVGSQLQGLGTEALFQLLLNLRELKRAGAPLSVFAFDARDKPAARMAAQARNVLAAVDERPEDLTLVLTHLLLARTVKSRPGDEDAPPMGWHLAQSKRPMTVLGGSHDGGTTWGCTELGECAVQPLQAHGEKARPFIRRWASPSKHGFDGVFHLGAVTASEPAFEVADRNKKLSEEARVKTRREKAEAAYKAKQYTDCARLYEEASHEYSSEQDQDAYGAACCHALAKDTRAAFDMLRRAASLGFDDWFHIQRDEDLAILRTHRLWRERLAAVRINLRLSWHAPGGDLALLDLLIDEHNDRYGEDEGVVIDWAQVKPRSDARRAQALQMLEARKPPNAVDHVVAANIFLLGDSVEDARKARELTAKAMTLDTKSQDAVTAAATAEDRELRAQGKPQRFGTQRHRVKGQWALYPVDPKTTDAERAKWKLPPLEELKQQAEEENTPAGG